MSTTSSRYNHAKFQEIRKPPVVKINNDSGEKVSIKINNVDYEVPKEATIMEAAAINDINISRLCYMPRLPPSGHCRACVVEVEGIDDLPCSCATQVYEGMNIQTNTPKVRRAAAAALHKIQSSQRHAAESVNTANSEFERVLLNQDLSCVDHNDAIQIDSAKCINCSRCVRSCSAIQNLGILKMTEIQDNIGPRSVVTVNNPDLYLSESSCIACGQCTTVCPTAAITEVDDIERFYAARAAGKVCVVQTAPSVRVCVGEEAGMEAGLVTTGQMVSALRQLGFTYCFDTNYSADLTIMEEGTELIQRVTENILEPTPDARPLPMFTSCCPAWVNYVEKYRPDLIPNLSSCKSPMSMLSAILKTHFAEKLGKKPEDIYVVAIMPCTAKKQECIREQLGRDGYLDTDLVLTTREMGKMIRDNNIDFKNLPEENFDEAFAESSGAGAIFGASGGVMEAALRTAYEVLTQDKLEKVEFDAVRGFHGVREVTIPVPIKHNGQTINAEVCVAICGGIKAAQELVKGNISKYHFIEVMACPSGCISGGGQSLAQDADVYEKRRSAIYRIDDDLSAVRRSHENVTLMKLYKDWLGEPNGHKAHHLLHTHYHDHTAECKDRVKIEIDDSDVSDGFLLVYATQTGNTRDLATAMARKLACGAKVDLKAADDIHAMEMKKYRNIVLGTCTFGMGEIPAMGKAFFSQLKDLPEGFLEGHNVAIFGIGSTAYGGQFNKAGKDFEDAFVKTGCTFVVDRCIADEKIGYDTFINPWTDQLMEKFGIEEAVPVAPPEPRYRITVGLEQGVHGPPAGYTYVKMTKNERITPDDYDVDVRLVSFSLKDGEDYNTGLNYQSSYHLAIHPANPRDWVKDFMTKCYPTLDPEMIIVVTPVGSNPVIPGLDKGISITELFTRYLDIYDLAKRDFFKALAPFAKSASTRRRLLHLGSKEGAEELAELKKNSGYTYADAITEFADARPPLAWLVDVIPQIKPRLYSIASSNKYTCEGETKLDLELVFGVVTYETKSGKTCFGRTGAYIADVDPTKEDVWVPVTIHESPYTPPELERPVICLSVGTGIAPNRSVIQDRSAEVAKHGIDNVAKVLLYHGCRYSKKDHVCADFLKKCEDEGFLIAHYAFSRDDPSRRVYLPDVIKENADDCFKFLYQEKAKVVYCGGTRMVPGIVNAFKEVIMDKGGLSEAEAQKWLDDYSAEEENWVFESF
ncbi:hypothetical protein PCE1_001296 [Barthelona sp. PCE]